MPDSNYIQISCRLTRANIKNFPKEGGVYCFFSGKKLIYIGKTKCMRTRISKHWYKFQDLADEVRYLLIPDATQRTETELWLIRKYTPVYNIRDTGLNRQDCWRAISSAIN